MILNYFLFEIHLTIDNIDQSQIHIFETLCQNLGGKAVIIELPIGIHSQQPMFTICQQDKQLAEILNFIQPIYNRLQQHGFDVVRQKIEIPANQSHCFHQHHPNIQGYYEWHGKVHFKQFNNDILQRVWQVANQNQAHISQNVLKNQQHHRFITIREHDEALFYQKIDTICQEVEQINQIPYLFAQNQQKRCVVLEKSQAEFCVYDDKLSLDDGWTQPVSGQSPISSFTALSMSLSNA